MKLKVGFHYHVPVVREGHVVRMQGNIARFVDSLAGKVGHLWALQHTALPHERELCDTALERKNVSLVSLGPHDSIPRRMARGRELAGIFQGVLSEIDILLIRGPSPLLPMLGTVALRNGMPVALLLVGDYVKGVSGLPQPRWRKELIRAWSVWNKLGQDRVARRSLVFVNSRELLWEYERKAARIVETRTTTLFREDLFFREDTCRDRPVKLLYAGRYDRAKGLLDILGAVRLLVEWGLDVEWHLAGWEGKRGGVMDEIRLVAHQWGLEDRVIDEGFLKVGEDLLGAYRSADIFVVASQAAEGFPRAIWEAMASSVPVVATRVGSIHHYLRDREDAILVNPRRPEELAGAIWEIVNDGNLRKRIIKNAFEHAASNTLEKRAQELSEELARWVEEAR